MKGLAGRVGCAASYISQVENGRRASPPSEGLLLAMERALGLGAGELVRLAQWQAAGPMVRREAAELARARQAARALAGAAGGLESGALDALYQSGELRRLIEKLAGAAEVGDSVDGGALPLARVLPVEVPLINSVAAGYPSEFTDLGYPARVADDYVRTPDVRDPDAFAARVVGDSMEPLYREGDIVVFSPAKVVKSGMDCFVRIEPDHESTFKRVYFEGEEGEGTGIYHRDTEALRKNREEGRGGEAGGGDGEGINEGREGGEGEKGGAGTGTGSGSGTRLGASRYPGRIRLQPLNSAYPARVLAREQVAGMYAAVSVTRVV